MRVLLWWLLLTARAIAYDATPDVDVAVAAYNHGDVTTAFRLLSAAATQGNSDAEGNLGYMYARGQGVAANQAEALRLYRLSAEQGNGEGMNAVGYKYEFGTGVTPNLQTAIDWYCRAIARDLWRQSAENGNTYSAYNLGTSLLAAPRASEESQLGLRWLQRAAKAGHAEAQRQLRALNYTGPLPSPFDSTGAMIIQPRDQTPGHAPVCAAPIS